MGNGNITKIFVLHYKPGIMIPNGESYVHIMAGNNGIQLENGFIGDDTGLNISYKNKYYSELTGIYWIWKNTNFDIIGTSHYRRFFTLAPIPLRYKLKKLLFYIVGLGKKREGLIYTSSIDNWNEKIISVDEVKDLLNQYDVILPKPRVLKYSVEEHYRRYHQISDLQIVGDIIKEKYPLFYSDYLTVLSGNRLYANNMFIIKRIDFDLLCNWLFDICFEFEKRVDLGKYSGYQERIIGFLSERLLTVWFTHNNLKIKQLDLIYFKKIKKTL